MRKYFRSFLIVVCSIIMLLSGCDDDKPINIVYPLDTSLAGSVVLGFRQITRCHGTFGENVLENFQSNESVIGIGKVSDEEIHLSCHTKWGDEWIDFSSEAIPLSGEPCNVNFDYSATIAKVKYNTTEWQLVSASFNGWIKRVDFDNTRNALTSNKNENDPPTFHYECDINISCIFEGEKLTLNITSIELF